MTLDKAIALCDQRRPNQYSREDKVEWLSNLDGRIFQDVLATHEGELPDFSGYDADTPGDTELLAKYPHDELYMLYLFAMVDFHNNDLQRYNASAAMYGQAYMEYQAWYTRNYMPRQQRKVTYNAKTRPFDPNNPLG